MGGALGGGWRGGRMTRDQLVYRAAGVWLVFAVVAVCLLVVTG